MNYKYYSETKIVNGATTVGLMPESQRPTYNQFTTIVINISQNRKWI